MEAPHGHLTIEAHNDAKGIALIAGGVGLAPLIGILRELNAKGDRRPTSLVYGNRHTGQIAFKEELATLERTHGTEITHVLHEPPDDWKGETGYITPDLLRRLFDTPDRREWLYILCGPPKMLELVEDTLISFGIPSNRIRSEQFVYD